MKTKLICLAFLLSSSALAIAQETATSIATQGLADLYRPSEAKASGDGRYSGIRLQETISVGDVVPLQYQRDGGMVSDSFMVTGIAVIAGRCTLESKSSQVAGALPEKILVACRVLR